MDKFPRRIIFAILSMQIVAKVKQTFTKVNPHKKKKIKMTVN